MSDLDVTLRVGREPDFSVEGRAVERLRATVRRRRMTKAEFVERLAVVPNRPGDARQTIRIRFDTSERKA